MLNLDPTPKDGRLIKRIADRAFDKLSTMSIGQYRRFYCGRDIIIVHLNGCPLDLKALLKASDFDFLHDVCGIREHLDRRLGKLRNDFVPRYTKR